MGTQNKHNAGLPAAIVGIAAALFLLFVYGYPRLFPRIEASDVRHFEANVDEALAAGNVDKATRIARWTVQELPLDPMAYTVYGNVLLASGKADEGVAQLVQAVGVQKELVLEAYRNTRKPFYFAPARLSLGKHYLEQNQVPLALANIELARAYPATADAAFARYREMLYPAYARVGLWAHALEFGEPSDGDLDALPSQDLVRIARVSEGRRNWDLAGRVAERLLVREGTAAEAHYLLGRISLARDEYDVSAGHLEQATAAGRSGAAYFLGAALEEAGQPVPAIRAFLRAPSGDVYRPFALAKALTLLEKLQEAEQATIGATRQEIIAQLDAEIAGLRLLKQPVLYDRYLRFTPVAFMPSETEYSSGGRFPLLVLWQDGQSSSADPERVFFSGSDEADSLVILRGNNTLLQLQWVENQVNWESVERLNPGTVEIPGWIDTGRDWFGLRTKSTARIDKDSAGNAYLSIVGPSWFFSVPSPARGGVGYLIAGRLKGTTGAGSFVWQGVDDSERVMAQGDIFEGAASDAWTWQAGYVRSQLQWDVLRLQLNVLPRAGTLEFDDVMLLEIREPDPAALAR